MESLRRAYAGKRVFITGHTGFKGSWLCEWLLGLGAEVWGYSLPPPTRRALFAQLGLAGRVRHLAGDVREPQALARAVRRCRPHFVFHLAAQPIVRASYVDPAETWGINAMGTAHLLDALRGLPSPCAAVIVTTDKVYADASRPQREDGILGGKDPYSASKAAAELAVASWRESFFSEPGSCALASARAGNVIGGGDWASDRLLPDCARALARGEPVEVRNPGSIRPWQHVLDPLGGYLMLGAELHRAIGSRARRAELCGAFNFGPAGRDHRPVRAVIAEVFKHWPGRWRRQVEARAPAETAILLLDIGKARRVLGWRPRWGFAEAIERTTVWYRDASPRTAAKLTRRQLAEHASALP